MNKILLCTIFKDDSEAKLVKRMLESFMPHVDGLVSVITGLGEHNQLIKLIKKHKGIYTVTDPENNPELYATDNDGIYFANFAGARNISFQLADAQEGYDWYIWADADDVLISGEHLKLAAEKASILKLDEVFFTYWYSVRRDKDGTFDKHSVEIEHIRERMLKARMFKWVSRLHEVAVPKDSNYKPKISNYEYDEKNDLTCAWVHLTENERVTKSSERNLKILEMQLKEEEGKDPRTLMFIAKTIYDLENPQHYPRAIELLNRYRQLSGWAEERADACEYLGKIYSKMGMQEKVIEYSFEAIKEFPDRHMPYLILAREYAEKKQFNFSDFWLQVALRMDPPNARTVISNPLEIKFMASSLLYNQAIRKNKIEDAIKWMETRNKLAGWEDDGMIKTLKEAWSQEQAARHIFEYAKWLKDTKNTSRIGQLIESLPSDLKKEPFAHYLANEVKEPVIWADKTIVYYASFGASNAFDWSPKSLEKGLGGSETAVVELSKRWAKSGYKVTVYCDIGDMEGEYEGVSYRHWSEINWKDEFNILILWRSPHLLERDLKAKKLYMDLHDVTSTLDWSDQRIKKIDRVFFKSKFHRDMCPNIPEEKVAIISNGL